MKTSYWIFAALSGCCLTGCNAPGPHFRDLDATRITVDEATFDVRVSQRLAEAIRVNPQYAPRLGAIAWKAARAMAFVSGCHVVEVRGDAAVATGVLDCGDGPSLYVPYGQLEYECVAVDGYLSSTDDTLAVDYDCEVVVY